VSSFKGRTGAVMPQSGDYTTDQVGEGTTNKYFTTGRASAAAPVQSVLGRTGAVAAQSGDYTTDQVTEGTNKYFTDARARGALSGMYQTPISGAPGTWPTFATVAGTGNYSDLSGKPTLGTAASHAATDFQAPISGAPSTWPTLATVAGSGSYADLSNKPTIPGAFSDLSGAASYAQLPALSYAFDFSVQSYSTGTVALTNGSNAITGTGTSWTSDMTGRLFIVHSGTCRQAYTFTYVSPTSGTLESTYGTGADGAHPCATDSAAQYMLNDQIILPASTHLLGTSDMTIQCYDNATPRVLMDDLGYAVGPSVDQTTFGVKIVFWDTRAGRCILHR
jgi:hypothetical protein